MIHSIKIKYICIASFITISCLFPFALFSQNSIETKMSLADDFFQNNEIEKALDLYLEIYETKDDKAIYKRLLDLYVKKESYGKAESLIKKRMRNREDEYVYNVDLGWVERESGNTKKAKQYFSTAIKDVPLSPNYIISLSNEFAAIEEFDYGIEVLEKGQKNTSDPLTYSFQLANLYGRKGDTEAMINQYMDVLESNENYLQSIQNVLQTVLNPDPNGEMKEKLKTNLIGRIQKNPDKTIFSELLIWMYIQEENFNAAFIQAKAIDKRLNESGSRIFALARLANSNKDYDVAIKAFNYILEKGRGNIYYNSARISLVEVIKNKILSSVNYTQAELYEVDGHYKNSIADLGENEKTTNLMIDYAHFLAFYLDSTSKAIDLLNKVIEIPRANRQSVAEAKIELADVLLIEGEIWESSLLYSQVEKEFKYDELGERAKFKNAKISYYNGDFLWSQAQLDALKGSTSKLISNDAIELSLLITDNVGVDSLIDPLQMYARAELLLFQNKIDSANKTLDSIPQFFPTTSLQDEILYLKYQISLKQKEYQQAADYLSKIVQSYSQDILGDNATFYLAELKEEKLNQKEEAMELYKKILTEYSGSIFVVEARKRFRKLRGDTIN